MKNIKTMDFFRHVDNFNIIHEKSSFFTKGQIGTWKYNFSEEIAKNFDELIEKKLKYNIDIDYEI
mgnify:CR=1 FL=1